MSAYYNENDPKKAASLRELIRCNFIAPGEVDERSVEDVRPGDLAGFVQCHFFAGIGIWSYALRLAGWPDDREVWTGSCPCQPFSAAGKQEGFKDERHLWPEWFRLIRECRPPVVFGEQVSAALGPRDSTRSLRALWEQKAYLRLCENWIRRTDTEHLQDVSQRPSPLASLEQAGPAIVPGEKVSRGRKVKIIGEGTSVRPNTGMGSGEDGFGGLRGDGNSLQPCGKAGLEHAVTGPDTSRRGLHKGQHEACSLRRERGLRELGREQDTGYCVSNSRKAQKEIGRLIKCVDGEIEAETGNSWVNLVSSDLEASGYTFGAVVLGAHSVGAPHIRQRLYFVADSRSERIRTTRLGSVDEASAGMQTANGKRERLRADAGEHSAAIIDPYAEATEVWPRSGEVQTGARANSSHGFRNGSEFVERCNPDGRNTSAEGTQPSGQYRLRAKDGRGHGLERDDEWAEVSDGSNTSQRGFGMYGSASGDSGYAAQSDETGDGLNAKQPRLEGHFGDVRDWRGPGWLDPITARSVAEAGATRGFWADCDWWYGRDGKYRPIGAGLFPLAYGAPERVGRLSCYGDGIVAQVAQAFIESYMSIED